MPVYRITDAAGELLRKVMCPADTIEKQLAADELAIEIDPLIDGLGVTAEMMAATDNHEADLNARAEA